MRLFLLALALAAAAPRPAGSAGPGPIDLKLNFQPGRRFAYVVRLVKTTEVQSAQTVQVIEDKALRSTFGVQAGEGSTRTLRLTYDWLSASLTVRGQQQRYDSRDSTTRRSPLAAPLAGMTGESLTIKLTSRGEVLSIEGLTSLNQHIQAHAPRSAAGQPPAPGQSENSIRSSLNQLFGCYPAGPVRPGASWVRSATLNMDTDTLQLTSTYTLASVQNGVAHLQAAGKLTGSGKAGAYTGTQSGTLDVDVTTGLVLRAQLRRTLAGHTKTTPVDFPVKSVTEVTTTGQLL